jgi:AraC-like DNA-binding protein
MPYGLSTGLAGGSFGGVVRMLSRAVMSSFTGTTFADLLDEVRRDAARRYLITAEQPVGQIVLMVGFGEQSTLATPARRARVAVMVRIWGVTPSASADAREVRACARRAQPSRTTSPISSRGSRSNQAFAAGRPMLTTNSDLSVVQPGVRRRSYRGSPPTCA